MIVLVEELGLVHGALRLLRPQLLHFGLERLDGPGERAQLLIRRLRVGRGAGDDSRAGISAAGWGESAIAPEAVRSSAAGTRFLSDGSMFFVSLRASAPVGKETREGPSFVPTHLEPAADGERARGTHRESGRCGDVVQPTA